MLYRVVKVLINQECLKIRTPLYRSPVILYTLRLNRGPHRTRVQDSDHFQRKRISSEVKAKELPVGERSQEILESGSRK